MWSRRKPQSWFTDSRGPRDRARRRFLRNAGLMTVAAPFVQMLAPRAQASQKKRMVLLFSGNGYPDQEWLNIRSENDFDFLRVTKPLERHRSESLFFKDLEMPVMHLSTFATVNHGLGQGVAYTGAPVLGQGWASGPSIDQLVAKTLEGSTPLTSIQVGSGVHDTNLYGVIAYADANKPLPPEQIPARAYANLFEPLLGRAGSNVESAQRVLERRKSVLDFVRSDICALSQELPAVDRARLERHCESLRDAERFVAASLEASREHLDACKPLSGLQTLRHSAERYQTALLQHFELVKLAFSCDLTRVVALQLGQASGSVVAMQANAENRHHHNASHWKTQDGIESYMRISAWYAKMVASFLDELKSVDEGGGNGTLLDNTVVSWATDVNEGEKHGTTNMPWALFGGKNLGLRGGRVVDVGKRTTNDLLLSLGHIMGRTELTYVGNREMTSGPITELG